MKYLVLIAMLISTALALPAPAPPGTQHPTSTSGNAIDLDHIYTHTSPIWSDLYSKHSRYPPKYAKASPQNATATHPHPTSQTNTTSATHGHSAPLQHHMMSNDTLKSKFAFMLSAKTGSKGTGTAPPYAPERTQTTSPYHNAYSPTLTIPSSIVKPTATNYLGYVQKPAQMFSASAQVWQTSTLTNSKPVATHLRGY